MTFSQKAVVNPGVVIGRTPLYRQLYVQVLFGIAIGAGLGHYLPDLAVAMKPLGDAFIKLVKMLIGPIIFTTVVGGIAKMGDAKTVGRVGVKALIYFEVTTTAALVFGLLAVDFLRPGAGMHVDPATLDPSSVAAYVHGAHGLSAVDFLMNIIPNTAIDAFARGDVLQVLLFAVLMGFALSYIGARGRLITEFLDQASNALFTVVGIIMRVAPIGAFGAMAFTIGKYGIATLQQLFFLVGSIYLTCALYTIIVLGIIMHWCGISLWRFLLYIKEEIFIVVGTASSEVVLPRLMAKLENLGCEKTVVGLVVPTGYSFNLTGSTISLSMAAMFLAQATDIPVSWEQQLAIVGLIMLTSKGAASVPGTAFVVLAATLSVTNVVPVAALSLILGVDRFVSEARGVTNLIGNGVATLVVSKWENALDPQRAGEVLSGRAGTIVADRPETILEEEQLMWTAPGAGVEGA